MTSHTQPVDTPPRRVALRNRLRKQDPIEVDKPKHDDEGDSVSVAKMGMIGTIGAALVTAVTTIVLAVSHDNGADTTTSAGQTIKPTLVNPSPLGSFDEVAINDSGTEVTVTGSAEKDVASVVVLIGPRQSGGQYWAASANVVNQQWKLAVATDPHIPVPYEIKAYYYRQQAGGAPVQGASYFTSQRTAATPTTMPPPGPPPEPVVNCAEQYGDRCFTGPGWGPPSVYQSDH
jgi:hypothetical protein